MQHDIFQVGQVLSFTTDSALYRDVYEAEIVAIHPDRLDLRLSLYQGYLLLLPVGTKISWLINNRILSTSRVLARYVNQQIWSVSRPEQLSESRRTRVLAVGSGKGGVGKTTFSINISIALTKCNQKVILLDADIGMANVEVLLGVKSYHNLTHVINGECTLTDILTEGPGGIRILPGSSGFSSLTQLDEIQFNRVFSGFAKLEEDCDVLILDTGAGLSELVLKFIEAADDFLLLTTPEPHALMDAYALTKVLSQRNPKLSPYLVINRCESEKEALQSKAAFTQAAKQFLHVEPKYLGWLPNDKLISRSLKTQVPILVSHSNVEFSRNVLTIAQKLLGSAENQNADSGLQGFWKRLKKSFS